MFDKIFSFFSKVNTGISRANTMQNTVDSVIRQKDNLERAGYRSKWYGIIFLIILVIVVLYIIFG